MAGKPNNKWMQTMSQLLKPIGDTGDPKINAKVNSLVNSQETIKYHGHHYIRKSGLKKKIKDLIVELSEEE